MISPPPVLATELAASEKVLWFGQPRQGLMLRSIDAFLIPFGLLCAGYAVFSIALLRFRVPIDLLLLVLLIGLLFAVISIYLLLGRFFVDARRRARTFYAVTTERVLIVTGQFTKTISSIELRTLGEMSVSEKSDGSGPSCSGRLHPLTGCMAAWPEWVSGRRHASRPSLMSGRYSTPFAPAKGPSHSASDHPRNL
jgi:hypothetical protein